jgi:hypothetical protein
VRRSKGHAQSVITTGDLIVNLDAKTVEVGGQRVHLTGKEYQMLELLSLRKGTTLTKEMFLNHLYGGMDEPELKIIDVFICKLRKKLRSPRRVARTTSKLSGAAAMCCAMAGRKTMSYGSRMKKPLPGRATAHLKPNWMMGSTIRRRLTGCRTRWSGSCGRRA